MLAGDNAGVTTAMGVAVTRLGAWGPVQNLLVTGPNSTFIFNDGSVAALGQVAFSVSGGLLCVC